MAAGGVLVGVLFGLAAGFIVSNKAKDVFAEYAQILNIPVVIGAYLTAEHWGASGFMAVFVAGLVYELEELNWTMAEAHHDEMHRFMHVMSLLLRIIVFILLGSHVDFSVVFQYLLPGLEIVAVFMLIARPIAVLAATLPDRNAGWTKQEIIFMFWTRETGIIPMAMAGIITGLGIRYAQVISAVVFIAVLTTLVIQAGTTKWLATFLGLLADPGDDKAKANKEKANL